MAGSGTSGDTRNPSFTVTDFDTEFMVPTNVHTYYLNLTTANANPDQTPIWEHLHDWKSEYGLKDMSPTSMLKFTQSLFDNSNLASQYEWNRARQATLSKPSVAAGNKRYLCQSASEVFEQKDCLGQAHISLLHGGSSDWFNFLIGNYISTSR